MARIPDKVIERIKAEVSLLEWVKGQGYELKQQGKDYAVLCPFHEEKTPSMMISPSKNLFHCFGCGAGGNVIDWVMKTENLDFRPAVEKILADNPSFFTAPALHAPPALARPCASASQIASPSSETIPETQAKNYGFEAGQPNDVLMNQVLEFYHECLLNSPEALAYLESRGLNDLELIKEFKLGFAPNGALAKVLPNRRTKAGYALRQQLIELGLFRQRGHEHFCGQIITPIFKGEKVSQLYGRKISPDLTKDAIRHFYLPKKQEGVFNEHGLSGCKAAPGILPPAALEHPCSSNVILCEALIDAMTFWVHGFKNVTASYGVNGFTKDHLALFKELGIEKVYIAYDRDQPGNTAAEKLAEQLKTERISTYRCLFPKGADVNEYALQVKPANKSLSDILRNAEVMFGRSSASMQPRHTVHPEHKPQAASDKSQEVETTSLLASPLPPKSESKSELQCSGDEIKVSYGNRHYRIRGLQKNRSYDVLKVNVLLEANDAVTVDTFDLYSAKHRAQFIRLAATECSVEEKIIRQDLGQLLLQLEKLQDQLIKEALEPKESIVPSLSESEETAALELLKDKNLAQRIINDFAVTGLVGEPTNALMGYLAAVSRKLKNPLAIIVQSTSAAGKSALMDAVLDLVPEEDKVHYSAMTGQSLFYLGETNLKHKILGIAEEEGVSQAAYALKILQSQGELTIASTGKDPQSGKLVTEEYRVEGPVMLFLTTTAIDIDEELLNRCVVLTINESREQSEAIQDRQRQARTLEGLLASNQSEHLIKQHQNAQRLLKPLAVVNPYAEQLTFASSRTRTRRDHQKYLTLIDSIALLHQFQRQVKVVKTNDEVIEYIEATIEDIALANELAHEILGRSLDELPPPTRKLLQQLHFLVAKKMEAESLRQSDVRFTRREVREFAGLSNSQVSVHLDRLVELEYVVAHSGKNGQRYCYELIFDGESSGSHSQLMGLIDVENLKKMTTNKKLPVNSAKLPATFRMASGHLPDSFRGNKNSAKPSNDKALNSSADIFDDLTLISEKNKSQDVVSV